MAETFDIVVLGAGPGGYVAAIRAAQLGQNVALVERESLGGVCLNWGCIPTKALLRNAEIANLLTRGNEFGFKVEKVSLDYSVAHKRSRQVSDRLVKGVGFLVRKHKITHVQGVGCLTSPTTVQVDGADGGQTLEAKNIILATGARPRGLPGMEVDGKRVITYRQALELTEVPKRMVIVGAGAIGMEFGYVFRSYGADVTVVEMMPQVLPLEDAETAAEVAKAFKKQGIKMLVNTRTEAIENRGESVAVRVKDQGSNEEQTIEADTVLVSVGVSPNSEEIGLEEVGVNKDKRGFVTVDEFMQTNVPGIYAIGDLTGRLLLAHVGSAQGIVAVEHIAKADPRPIREADYAFMPRATYCQPQVASMGLTEAQARETGREILVGKFPFIANGKALGLGEKEGFVKVIVDKRYGEILGAHMVGPDVTELLPEFVLAHHWELTIDEIARTVHSHPTLSEAIMEAAHAVHGQAIHI